ncbi:SubName: Full=Uncharacterized protein {ECO:0000313/EMBL:CCA72653.1} [Serendipita indica DSM 11827]|nr:SubName: Full=Uncharacterized protein {ECO:0000313/EMBL:CCA72653.1} [Serendipita indica DSM 11827]
MFGVRTADDLRVTASEDLCEFLSNHAATLEEIGVPAGAFPTAAEQVNWSHFPRLKLLMVPDLPELVDILPSLAIGLERKEHKGDTNGLGPPLFTVILCESTSQGTAAEMVARLQPYHSVLQHIKVLWYGSWAEALQLELIENNDNPWELLEELEARKDVRFFLRVIDNVPLLAFDCDGKPANCDEANALRSLVFGTPLIDVLYE